MKPAQRLFFFGFLLIFAIVLSSCAAPEAPALREGLTMAWVDGSNLFSLLCDGKWMWTSITPVTNNMYSLCIQAGDCTPPAGPQEAKDLTDPNNGNQLVKIVGPDKNITPEQAASYCGWIGGRMPTEEEAADMQADLAGKFDANENPLYPGDDGAIRCVLDSPRPMAFYCQGSPYYDPTQPVEDHNHAIEPAGTFCQNDKSYVTFDVALDPASSIESVTPDGEEAECEVLEGNRILCGSSPNSSTSVIAGLVCDSKPVILESSIAGIMDSSIAGIMDSSWELNSNGVPVPTNNTRYPGDVLVSGPFTPKFAFVNGVMVAQSAPGSSAPGSAPSPVCPIGYYYDDQAQNCISVAPPADTTCIDGFDLDPSNSCCEVSTPNGNYPGCPAGQYFDPQTGLCDSHTTIVSPTSILHTQSFDVNFIDCSSAPGPGGGSGPDGTGPGGGCPPGQTYTCEPVCGCAPG
jgi:hypothetical protein